MPPATDDIVYHLRRHAIPNLKNFLADEGVQTQLREIVREWRRSQQEGSDPPPVAGWMRRAWAWLRDLLRVPPCTNSVSLYLFFLTDAIMFVLCVKLGRFLLRLALQPHARDRDAKKEVAAEPWWKRHIEHVPRLVAFPGTIVVVWVVFRLMHRWKPWIEEPHTLLTLALTGYLFAYTYLDAVIPDLPGPASV